VKISTKLPDIINTALQLWASFC